MIKNTIIVKSNDLVQSSYKLTLDEMRVLLLTIGRIDPELPNHRRDFEFTVAEFAEQFGVDEKIAYQQVQKAIDTLGSRWAVLEDNPKLIRKVIFLTDQTYFKGEGRFQIILHEKLMPFVSDIKNSFTKYSLEYVAKFSSFYAIRIYEIVAQFRQTGWRDITVAELKDWLQVTDKYDRWDNFKRWVLEPSIKEINKKSDLFISVDTIKRGRSIHSLRFTIKPKSQAVENDKNLTKSGRPKLPQRPQVAKGSQAEFDWAKSCINLLEDWRKSLKEQGLKLDVSDLKLLKKYYKLINDTITVEEIDKAIAKRKG